MEHLLVEDFSVAGKLKHSLRDVNRVPRHAAQLVRDTCLHGGLNFLIVLGR